MLINLPHFMTLDEAKDGLQKLDDDITQVSNATQSEEDLLKLSRLVHVLTHRLCRTLEISKAACNRAPSEQRDGEYTVHTVQYYCNCINCITCNMISSCTVLRHTHSASLLLLYETLLQSWL